MFTLIILTLRSATIVQLCMSCGLALMTTSGEVVCIPRETELLNEQQVVQRKETQLGGEGRLWVCSSTRIDLVGRSFGQISYRYGSTRPGGVKLRFHSARWSEVADILLAR